MILEVIVTSVLESVCVINFLVYFYFYWILKREKYVIEKSISYLIDNIVSVENDEYMVMNTMFEELGLKEMFEKEWKKIKLENLYSLENAEDDILRMRNETIKRRTLKYLQTFTLFTGCLCIPIIFLFNIDGANVIMNVFLTLLGTILGEFLFVELILKNIILADPFIVKRDTIFYMLNNNKDKIPKEDLIRLLEAIMKLEEKTF